jgi:hypothetical protein
VPIVIGTNNLHQIVNPSYDDPIVVPNRLAIAIALAGAWCLAVAPMVRSARLTVFGSGLTWPAGSARRALTKRILAGAAATAAVLNVVILWLRIDSEWSTAFSDRPPGVAPWEFRLISVAFVGVLVELAISRETGRYQRWLNPVRAAVVILYASTAGEGSAYLYWFTLPPPWTTVLPTVLAVLAAVVVPRGTIPTRSIPPVGTGSGGL